MASSVLRSHFYSVKPGLIKHILLVWMGYKLGVNDWDNQLYIKTTYESRKLKLYTELTLVYTRQTALFTQFEIDVAEHNFCGIESHCKVFIQKH